MVPSVRRDDHPPRVQVFQGGSGLHFDRDAPAGQLLDAALRREIPARARLYDEAGARWLVVAPHDERARQLFRERFPAAPIEPGAFTSPRMTIARGAGRWVA